MGKGAQTKQAILDEAVSLASQVGLSALSIGGLAERSGMSKSGLFAHFGSKEDMQLAVIAAAQERFLDVVLRPALKSKRGLPRLRAMMHNWIGWSQKTKLPGGCVLMAASIEFDDQPGPVRDAVAAGQRGWRRTLADAVSMAVGEGHLRADTDVDQFVFEMVGIVMVAEQNSRLFGDRQSAARGMAAFDRLVRDCAPAAKRRKE